MLASGWVEEVRTLLRAGYHGGLTPLKGLGYKEIIRVISGQCDHAAAVETIKQNTRRFAKRQQTWFRGDSGVTWIDVSDLSSAEVATRLLAQLSKTAG
jgi:tRNA dimethylallyltransferase